MLEIIILSTFVLILLFIVEEDHFSKTVKLPFCSQNHKIIPFHADCYPETHQYNMTHPNK